MPVHDWSKLAPAFFHDFHHAWIEEIKRALNNGVLPEDFYAMAEQWTPTRESDVLALRGGGRLRNGSSGPATGVLPRPKVQSYAKIEVDGYRRKKSHIAVHHASNDEIVAIIEIVSAGNKSNKKAFQEFIDKALELIEAKVHLLLIDVLPRTKRDPDGIHPAIWENIIDEYSGCHGDGRLSSVAYEVFGGGVNSYCETYSVGSKLPNMPLFLDEDAQVPVPLEQSYLAAFQAVPSKWRKVIEGQ